MDRQKVQYLREKLSKTLQTFAEENGLESATFNNITFDQTSFKTTLHINEKVDKDTKIKEFDMKASIMALPQGLYNKEITFQDQTFIVKDINTRAKKYPIIAEGQNGTSYKLPPNAVE